MPRPGSDAIEPEREAVRLSSLALAARSILRECHCDVTDIIWFSLMSRTRGSTPSRDDGRRPPSEALETEARIFEGWSAGQRSTRSRAHAGALLVRVQQSVRAGDGENKVKDETDSNFGRNGRAVLKKTCQTQGAPENDTAMDR